MDTSKKEYFRQYYQKHRETILAQRKERRKKADKKVPAKVDKLKQRVYYLTYRLKKATDKEKYQAKLDDAKAKLNSAINVSNENIPT
jgi:hypothetical protein